MQHDEFDRVFEETVEKSRSVLASKSKEYSTEDKLHNFKVSAATRGVSNRDALAGMMVKHTTSIYDLCRADECVPLAVWDEKIGDHINYLILLRAMVIEELGKKQADKMFDLILDDLKSVEDEVEARCPVTGIDPGDSDEVVEHKLARGVRAVYPELFVSPELHTNYVCPACGSERVNTTHSGTLYDRITCLFCASVGVDSWMKPIIENERSGVDKMYKEE